MLTRIELKNYKCFEALDLRLPRLCALVGPNNSGKSTVLDALQRLGETTRHPVKNIFAEPYDVRALTWAGAGTPGIGFGVEVELADNKACRYQLDIGVDASQAPMVTSERIVLFDKADPSSEVSFQAHPSNYAHTALHARGNLQQRPSNEQETRILQLENTLKGTVAVRFYPQLLAEPCAIEAGEQGLTSLGEGLPAVLDFRKGERLELFLKIQTAFTDAFPEFKEIVVRKKVTRINKVPTQTTANLSFRTKTNFEIPAQLASEGMLLYLAYLTLLYSEQAPHQLLIEEPENGNHPKRLGQVIDVLRKISRGEGGARPVQVIMTTHSPYMLDFLQPEEVFVTTREPGGPAKVTPLADAPHLEERLQDFTLGELWYNVGEQALVKGNKEGMS